MARAARLFAFPTSLPQALRSVSEATGLSIENLAARICLRTRIPLVVVLSMELLTKRQAARVLLELGRVAGVAGM